MSATRSQFIEGIRRAREAGRGGKRKIRKFENSNMKKLNCGCLFYYFCPKLMLFFHNGSRTGGAGEDHCIQAQLIPTA